MDTKTTKTETNPDEVRAVIAASKAKRQGAKTPDAVAATALIPMTTDAAGIEEALSAEATLLQMSADAGRIDDETWEKLNETYIVFVKCRHTHKAGRPAHALYLKDYPRGTAIHHTNWRARVVKETFEAPYYQPTVRCQACLFDDFVKTVDAVTITSPEGDLEVDPRWICRRPRQTERARIEGETCVFARGLPTQNQHRHEANARVRAEYAAALKAGDAERAAIYEVIDE